MSDLERGGPRMKRTARKSAGLQPARKGEEEASARWRTNVQPWIQSSAIRPESSAASLVKRMCVLSQRNLKAKFVYCRTAELGSIGALGNQVLGWIAALKWEALIQGERVVYPALVEEFYSNLIVKEEGEEMELHSIVQGTHIQLNDYKLARYIGIPFSQTPISENGWTESKLFSQSEVMHEIFGQNFTAFGVERLSRAQIVNPLYGLLHYVVSGCINLRRQSGRANISFPDMVIMHAVMSGISVNLGDFVLRKMKSAYERKGTLLYADLLSRIFEEKVPNVFDFDRHIIDHPITSKCLPLMGFVFDGHCWSRKVQSEPIKEASTGPHAAEKNAPSASELAGGLEFTSGPKTAPPALSLPQSISELLPVLKEACKQSLMEFLAGPTPSSATSSSDPSSANILEHILAVQTVNNDHLVKIAETVTAAEHKREADHQTILTACKNIENELKHLHEEACKHTRAVTDCHLSLELILPAVKAHLRSVRSMVSRLQEYIPEASSMSTGPSGSNSDSSASSSQSS